MTKKPDPSAPDMEGSATAFWDLNLNPPVDHPSYTGTLCVDCASPQFMCRGGVTCLKGHGGAPGIPVDVEMGSRIVEAMGQAKEQPLPKKGWGSVTTSLRQWLGEFLDRRESKGIATYGQSLQIFDGRDNIRDLQEELLDALQYTQKWAMERKALDSRIRLALKILDLEAVLPVTNRLMWSHDQIARLSFVENLKKAFRSEDPSHWLAGDIGFEQTPDPKGGMKR